MPFNLQSTNIWPNLSTRKEEKVVIEDLSKAEREKVFLSGDGNQGSANNLTSPHYLKVFADSSIIQGQISTGISSFYLPLGDIQIPVKR